MDSPILNGRIMCANGTLRSHLVVLRNLHTLEIGNWNWRAYTACRPNVAQPLSSATTFSKRTLLPYKHNSEYTKLKMEIFEPWFLIHAIGNFGMTYLGTAYRAAALQWLCSAMGTSPRKVITLLTPCDMVLWFVVTYNSFVNTGWCKNSVPPMGNNPVFVASQAANKATCHTITDISLSLMYFHPWVFAYNAQFEYQ